jgi:predicted metal-dependent enzyme (double-stranded beta helix superfamily)
VLFEVDAFVADCERAVTETQPALAVKEVVERAISRPTAIDEALGVPTSWALRTLHCSPRLTVLHLVWPPRVVLFPHDHRMWAANGIYGGGEDNIFYRRIPNGIERSGGKLLGAGEVALLGVETIHSVTNPYDRYTAAIHVYGGDFFGTPRSQWDPSTMDEEPFDAEAVRGVLAAADCRTQQDGA